jgi:uncharacterized membrane protein YagU involved in acid resistance
MQCLVAGAVAGFCATIPMTVAMHAWHRRLPWAQREALPPKPITLRVLAAMNARPRTSSGQDLATMAAHFAFGTTVGVPYGCCVHFARHESLLTGMLYGAGLWALSYLGALPSLGLYRSPLKEPLERQALVLGAHLVWGATLGALTAAMRRTHRTHGPLHRRSAAAAIGSRNGRSIGIIGDWPGC